MTETYVSFLMNNYILSMEKGEKSATESEDKEEGAEGLRRKETI